MIERWGKGIPCYYPKITLHCEPIQLLTRLKVSQKFTQPNKKLQPFSLLLEHWLFLSICTSHAIEECFTVSDMDSSLSNLYQKPDIMTSSRNILCLPALDKVEFSTDVGHNIFLFWYQALSMFHMPLSTFLCAWTNVLYIKTLRMHFSAGARKSREFTFSILSWLSSSIHSHTTKLLRWVRA